MWIRTDTNQFTGDENMANLWRDLGYPVEEMQRPY